jgi:hypothetical protein
MMFRLPFTAMPGSLSLARVTFTFGNPGQKIRTPGFYVYYNEIQ